MLPRLAFILTALTAFLAFGGVAGVALDIAPRDLMAIVLLGALACGTLAIIPINFGLLLATTWQR